MAWKTHIVTLVDLESIIASAPDLVVWIMQKEQQPGACGQLETRLDDEHTYISRWWKHKTDAEQVIEFFKSANIELVEATITEIPDPD